MMGFSEEEVRNLLLSVLEDKSRETAIMQDLKRYYNGYKFFQHSQQNVYNSDMVLYFLDHFKEEQTYPSQMLDPNIMPDYGKLKRMFEVANWRENVKVLEEVLEKGSVSAEHIYQFSFENGFGRKEFINFLFYLGNLTIQETDIMALMAYLIQANIFWVQSKREIAGGGYVDIELFIRPNNPYAHHQFAIELKYLKKEQAHLVSEVMAEAKAQILSYYQKGMLLPSKAMLHLLAVVVVKDEVWVEEVALS